MPRLSQLIIRAALLWLAAGATLGGLMLLNKGWPLLPWVWALRTAHVHMLLMGWTVQFAWGVAFWILPRLDAGGARGDTRLVWIAYVALNSAVALVVFDGVFGAIGAPRPPALTLMGAALYLAAAASFVAHAWPRILPFQRL